MASLSSTKRNKKTCYQIWVGTDPHRSNIWLGAISKSNANEIFSYINQVEQCRNHNTILTNLTRSWLQGLDDRFYGKLVKADLVKPRSCETVKKFFEEQLLKLNCAPRTKDIYHRAHLKFFEFLQTDYNLRDVSPKMAHDFYFTHLAAAGLAESYRSKTAKIIREFFSKAKVFELIDRNPFDGFEISEPVDRSRHVFIPRDSINLMIEKAADIRWRCLLGFAGLCGLRTRSEIAALRWEHIEWDDNTFTVPSVKTKTRTVPIFGDFRPLLEAYHQLTIKDDLLVVPSGLIFPQCPSQTQLTNRLKRTATKAGLQPWVKPWMNLRSSVETQLIREGFDLTTVSTWLGNSPDVARKHYLQVTPTDISKAAAVGKKFSNSFQHTGESGSTPKEKPAFSRMVEHEKAGQYT